MLSQKSGRSRHLWNRLQEHMHTTGARVSHTKVQVRKMDEQFKSNEQCEMVSVFLFI